MARAEVGAPGLLGLVLCLLLAGCGETAPEPPTELGSDGADAEGSGPANPTYEQNFVFASLSGDSTFLVPWLTRTTVYDDRVAREARGWLGRGGTWDAFFTEEWSTRPTRAPARMLPYGDMKLLVQEGDVVDGIIFEEGARRLELVLGEVLASWDGPRGETVDLVDGSAYLSDERVEGSILHLARASAGDDPPGGDWGLVMSGDSMRLVLAADSEHGGEVEPLYRAWMDLDDEELLWPEVRVDWSDAQAFPPARRDVPVAWTIWSADESIEGDLEAVSAEIQPGPGPGPLLPVRALFEVVGRVFTGVGEFPVRGLMVHERR